MKKTAQQITSILICLLVVSVSIAHGQTPASRNMAQSGENQFTNLLAQVKWARRPAFRLMPESNDTHASAPLNFAPPAAAANFTALTGGTIGRPARWTGFTGSNWFLGDQSTRLANGPNLVKSLNGLTGDLTLQAGANIALTTAGNTLTIAAPNALTTVAHDQSLTGDGTAGNPLRVAHSSQPPPEPVSVTARFTISAGKSLGGAPLLTVPAGKRLTVEHGSGHCSTPPGQFVWQFELSALGGGTSNPTQIIVPTFVGADPALGSFFAASLPVKLYASAGSEVQVQAWRGTVVTNDCYCTFHLTGVLTDQP